MRAFKDIITSVSSNETLPVVTSSFYCLAVGRPTLNQTGATTRVGSSPRQFQIPHHCMQGRTRLAEHLATFPDLTPYLPPTTDCCFESQRVHGRSANSHRTRAQSSYDAPVAWGAMEPQSTTPPLRVRRKSGRSADASVASSHRASRTFPPILYGAQLADNGSVFVDVAW